MRCRLQPAQAPLALLFDLGGGQAARAALKSKPEFGFDNDAVAIATFLHPRADDAFTVAAIHEAGQPAAVHIGGIDEVAALLVKIIEEAEVCGRTDAFQS